MLSRRSAIALVQTTGILVTAPGLVRRAWAQPHRQSVLSKTVTGQLAISSIARTRRRRSAASLQQVIDATVDVNDIARFCLGRFWRSPRPSSRNNTLACLATCW